MDLLLHLPLLLLQQLLPRLSPITLVDHLTTLKSLDYVQSRPNLILSELVNLLLPQLQQIDSFPLRPTTLLSKISATLFRTNDPLSTPPLRLQQEDSIINPLDPRLLT